MNKNVIFIGLLVVTAFIIGMVFFKKGNNQIVDKSKKPTPTSTSETDINITPTKKPTVSDEEIDAKLKDLDSDVNNINNSFSDTAVDVMSE